MSKLLSSLVLVALTGTVAYLSGTAIKADMAEKSLARPTMGVADTLATSTATSTTE